MLNWLKSKWLMVLAGLILAIGCYALIGFKLVPKLIRSQAIAYAQTEWKKPLTLGEIKVNPFSFELEMRDIALNENGKPLLTLKRLFVDFQASSLFKHAYVFNTVQLDGPFSLAVIKPDGSLNLAELLPKEKNDEPLPNLWIADLSVNAGKVNFADKSRELKPEKVLSPITFSLKNFKTRDAGGGFTLSSSGDDGEQFEWKGSLNLQPISSKGQFKVSGFKATSAYEFLSAELPFQMTQGSFSLHGDYDFAINDKNGLQLTVAAPLVEVSTLAVRPKNSAEDWIRLPDIKLINTQIDLAQQRASIAEVAVQGMQAKAWLESDGSLNLIKLTEQGAKIKQASSSPWQAEIGKFSLSDASIELEDRTIKPSGKFKLTSTEFSTNGLSLNLDKPLPITLTSIINGKAPLRLTGTVVPASITADVAVELSAMPIVDVLMYLPDYKSVLLKSGTLATSGQLVVDEQTHIHYRGKALVDNFRLMDTNNNSDLLSFQKAQVDGIDFQQSPFAVTIDTVDLDKPFIEVVVTPNQTINLLDLLANDTVATAQSGAKNAVIELPVKLNNLMFHSGTMAFADYSIQPNFKAKIENLNGHVLGISGSANSIADIDLTGFVVNKYSPVMIKGKTTIFDFEKQTDIEMAFRNIELPIFNPYSGRFAGYAIDKGKLTTELHYRIENKKLQADHHIILDQLTWGEKTDSKDKVSLPVRLGSSLLKDKNGVIDLNVPVNGSIDDPKFRIGPIVWQIIKNLIVKAVSAPFSFIGSLFAGAEQAQFVDFNPGSAVLPEAAQKSLPIFATALSERQAVNLDIPYGTLAELDASALTEMHLHEALQKIQSNNKKTPVAYDDLEPKQQLALLEDLYKQQFGKKPDVPKAELSTEQEVASRKEKRSAKKSIEVEWLEAQLKPKFQATDDELKALGQARGEAVQEALLKGGTLDPTRVFMTPNSQLKEVDGKVRMELQMK